MRRFLASVVALALLASSVTPAPGPAQQGTLEQDQRDGHADDRHPDRARRRSPTSTRKNEWVGFSIDLVEELVKPALEKKLGKPIKVEKKESTPPTRIPLLSSGAVDLIAGTMTDTRTRRDSVDFSITFFVTGRPVPGEEGQPDQGHQGHRRQAHRRPAGLDQRPDHPREGAQGQSCASSPTSPRPSRRWCRARWTPTPTTASSSPGSRPRRRIPAQWDIVGDFFSYEPYGMAMRKGDADFRNVVNGGPDGRHRVRQVLRDLREVVRAQGRAAVSDGRRVRSFMLLQVVPK